MEQSNASKIMRMQIPRPCALGLVFWMAASAAAQSFQDNVVIVLDASGSMSRPMPGSNVSKMEAAQEALKEVLKNVAPSTRIGLLVFSAKNITSDWVYPLGPRDNAELLKAIDLPVPHGSTPLGKYIKMGADRLLEERKKQFDYGTFRLLVVTDGEANDQPLVDRFTPEVIARGITMDVIGVAMKQDHTLATKVHSYRRANDPGSLSQAIQEVFAEVSQSATDVAGEEAFALIAPLPVEVASSAIQSLSTSGNQPIGENPTAAAQTSDSQAPAPAPRAQPAPKASPPPVAVPPVERRGPNVWMILVGTIVFWMVLRALFRKR